MKKRFNLFSLSLIAIVFIACGPTKKDIVKYNDDIVKEQKSVINAEKSLLNLASKLDTLNIDKEYGKFTETINKAIENVKNIKEVDKDLSLKEAAIKLFESYKSVAENEYKEVVRITKIPTPLYTAEEQAKNKKATTSIDEKLNAELKSFLEVQKKLAEKHKFEFYK